MAPLSATWPLVTTVVHGFDVTNLGGKSTGILNMLASVLASRTAGSCDDVTATLPPDGYSVHIDKTEQ